MDWYSSEALSQSKQYIGWTVACIGLFPTIFACTRAIRNVFYHPLALYPGPWWSAISGAPALLASVTGQSSYYALYLHQRYGDVVRIGPNELSYITAGGWRDIYGHKAHLPKNTEWYMAPPNGIHNILSNADNEDHSRMRRLLANAFSDQALRQQEDLVKVHINLLVEGLRRVSRHDKNEIDIIEWFSWTTFDIIGDLIFGESFGCLRNTRNHPWVEVIIDGIKAIIFINAARVLYGGTWILRAIQSNKTIESRERHHEQAVLKVHRRLEKDTDRPDLMTYILRHNDERGMSVPEIEANADTLLVAGFETTSTLLSGLTFYLLQEPRVMKKLVQEIRRSWKHDDEIDNMSAAKIEYLNAVIKEGLRAYPPVPVGLLRRVPAAGAMIDGQWVPPDTVVSVNQWAAYRCSRNFTDAYSFVPERFLGDERFASDRRDCLEPFSLGPRGCLGKHLAYSEIRVILARLLWNFDIELLPGQQDWAKQKMYILWQKEPLMVKVSERV